MCAFAAVVQSVAPIAGGLVIAHFFAGTFDQTDSGAGVLLWYGVSRLSFYVSRNRVQTGRAFERILGKWDRLGARFLQPQAGGIAAAFEAEAGRVERPPLKSGAQISVDQKIRPQSFSGFQRIEASGNDAIATPGAGRHDRHEASDHQYNSHSTSQSKHKLIVAMRMLEYNHGSGCGGRRDEEKSRLDERRLLRERNK